MELLDWLSAVYCAEMARAVDSELPTSASDALAATIYELVVRDPPPRWESQLAVLAGPRMTRLVVGAKQARSAAQLFALSKTQQDPLLGQECDRLHQELRRRALDRLGNSHTSSAARRLIDGVRPITGAVALSIIGNLITDLVKAGFGAVAQRPLTWQPPQSATGFPYFVVVNLDLTVSEQQVRVDRLAYMSPENTLAKPVTEGAPWELLHYQPPESAEMSLWTHAIWAGSDQGRTVDLGNELRRVTYFYCDVDRPRPHGRSELTFFAFVLGQSTDAPFKVTVLAPPRPSARSRGFDPKQFWAVGEPDGDRRILF